MFSDYQETHRNLSNMLALKTPKESTSIVRPSGRKMKTIQSTAVKFIKLCTQNLKISQA